jgi:hypothetical protein
LPRSRRCRPTPAFYRCEGGNALLKPLPGDCCACSARMRTTSARRNRPSLSPLVRPARRREGERPSPRGKCLYESGAGCTSGGRDPVRCAGRCTQADTHKPSPLDCGGVQAQAWREFTPVSSNFLGGFGETALGKASHSVGRKRLRASAQACRTQAAPNLP